MSKELIERLREAAAQRVASTAMIGADDLIAAADALEIATAGMNAYSDELGSCRKAAGFGSADDPMAQEGFDAFGDPLCVAAFVESQFKRVAAERDALAASIRDAAVTSGICRNDAPLTGPMLVMLCGNMVDSIVSLAAELKALREQAPVARIDDDESFQGPCRHAMAFVPMHRGSPLYAYPVPARELTDETIQRHWDEACKDTPQTPGWSRHIRFARAIERYLKGEGE